MSNGKPLLAASGIKKYYNGNLMLECPSLSVSDGDRIGIVGANGAGKSTLLKLLSGAILPEEGQIRRFCSVSVIPQLENAEPEPERLYLSILSAPNEERETLSGGERMRRNIAAALSASSALLAADEPTANLDAEGAELVLNALCAYRGAVVLVSHDRELLDAVCNSIWEVQDGSVTIYPGNYTAYETELLKKRCHLNSEREKYISEKSRLQGAVSERAEAGRSMKKTPSRMGNSEARLHKTETRDRRKSVDNQSKAIKTRLEQLEYVAPVKDARPHILPVTSLALRNRYAVRAEHFSLAFAGNVVFDGAQFQVETGSRTHLSGPNGSGKTCLFNAIHSRAEGIYLPPQVVPVQYLQNLAWFNPLQSVRDCVMENCAQQENTVRMMLANLQIGKEYLSRQVGVLSGGERVKVRLVKALAAKANLLLLDEPTNYLDIASLKALEDFLLDYPGTVLFVSHDARFSERVATSRLVIRDRRVERS